MLHDVILGEPFFHVAVVSFGPNEMKISKWPDNIQAEVNEILQKAVWTSSHGQPKYKPEERITPLQHAEFI